MSIIPEPPTNSPDDAEAPTDAPVRSSRRWVALTATGAGGFVLGTLLGVGFAGIDFPTATPVPDALSTCGVEGNSYFDLGDDGKSVTIETVGEKKSYGAEVDDAYCVLRELGASDSMIARIGQTRALDGRQTASWKGFTASWSYHPKNGMNLVIEPADH